MSALPVTSVTAGLLGLLYLVLAGRVIARRGSARASLGDGSTGMIAPGEERTVPLLVAVRSHANFSEYVPLALILLALNEQGGAPRWFVLALAAALVLGRLLHPVGMGRKIPNLFRAGGVVLTLSMLAAASLGLILRGIR